MKNENYITEMSGDEQKKVAIEMWEYIRKWYDKHPGVYMHPFDLKQRFADDYYRRTRITIDWHCYCMFCSIFNDDGCYGCPLAGENEYSEPTKCLDYAKLCEPAFQKFSFMRDRICRDIISAFKSYNYDKE